MRRLASSATRTSSGFSTPTPGRSSRAYAPTPGLDDWQAVDLGNVDGATLLKVVRDDVLWLNVIDLEHDQRSRKLQDRLFAEIGQFVPDLVPGTFTSTLLVSSPGTTVPFHLDPEPNVLWQIRGHKRIYIYPALNNAFVSQWAREELFAGTLREYAPYQPSFDEAALTAELNAGDVIAWPQNAPHRVVNLDGTNVTLSTEFQTRRTRRRRHVYCANRFLNRRVHLPVHATTERGLASTVKIGAFGLARKLRLDKPGVSPPITAELRLTATGHIEKLDAPIQAVFT